MISYFKLIKSEAYINKYKTTAQSLFCNISHENILADFSLFIDRHPCVLLTIECDKKRVYGSCKGGLDDYYFKEIKCSRLFSPSDVPLEAKIIIFNWIFEDIMPYGFPINDIGPLILKYF